jgi:hypothetical protein
MRGARVIPFIAAFPDGEQSGKGVGCSGSACRGFAARCRIDGLFDYGSGIVATMRGARVIPFIAAFPDGE